MSTVLWQDLLQVQTTVEHLNTPEQRPDLLSPNPYAAGERNTATKRLNCACDSLLRWQHVSSLDAAVAETMLDATATQLGAGQAVVMHIHLAFRRLHASAHLALTRLERLNELHGSTPSKAELPARDLCRVRSEAVLVADAAPEPPDENLKAAVLEARP